MPSPADDIRNWRSIIETERFRRELADIIADEKKADEFIDAAKWLLPWNPFVGYQLVPSQVWFLPIAEAAGRAALYYMFNDQRIVFLSIRSHR